MTLEIIPSSSGGGKLLVNGFVLMESVNIVALENTNDVLQRLFTLHRTYTYEEHSLNKSTGEPVHELRLTIHVVK
jgi:hypothetical protein